MPNADHAQFERDSMGETGYLSTTFGCVPTLRVARVVVEQQRLAAKMRGEAQLRRSGELHRTGDGREVGDAPSEQERAVVRQRRGERGRAARGRERSGDAEDLLPARCLLR